MKNCVYTASFFFEKNELKEIRTISETSGTMLNATTFES